MTLPTHILVATDFSEASSTALSAAAAQAKAAGSKLTLIHVYDPTPMVPPAAIPTPRKMEDSIAHEMAERVQSELERVRREHLSEVDDVELVALRHANAAYAICEHADNHGVELIVLGTHGRTGLSHLLIGSVAERVVRHAHVPVLTVPSHGQR